MSLTLQGKSLGFLFSQKTLGLEWCTHHTILPTPYLISENEIRVYFGGTDKNYYGHLGYVDVQISINENKFEIKDIAQNPILSNANCLTFAKNGINPVSLFKKNNKLYLTVVGYDTDRDGKLKLMSGLVESQDEGKTFLATQYEPILTKENNSSLLQSALFMDPPNHRGYFVSDIDWLKIDNKWLPKYGIAQVEFYENSWNVKSSQFILKPQGDEMGLARPWQFNYKNDSFLIFGVRKLIDGKLVYKEFGLAKYTNNQWVRLNNLKFTNSGEDWDSNMTCYGAIIQINNRLYMLYNGNANGVGGVGIAKLEFY